MSFEVQVTGKNIMIKDRLSSEQFPGDWWLRGDRIHIRIINNPDPNNPIHFNFVPEAYFENYEDLNLDDHEVVKLYLEENIGKKIQPKVASSTTPSEMERVRTASLTVLNRSNTIASESVRENI